MNRRYGTFCLSDHLGLLLASIILLSGALMLIWDAETVVYGCLLIIMAGGMLISVASPYVEKFKIFDDTIVTVTWKRRILTISEDPVVVITHADINTDALARASGVSQTATKLRNKYAAVILKKMPLPVVLDHLHRNGAKQYTCSTVENSIREHFVYSFVCDAAIINCLITDRRCLLIVPASIEPIFRAVLVGKQNVQVYIDRKA